MPFQSKFRVTLFELRNRKQHGQVWVPPPRELGRTSLLSLSLLFMTAVMRPNEMEQGEERRETATRVTPHQERERGKNPLLLPFQKPSPNQGGVSGTVRAAPCLSSLTLFLLDFDGDGESGEASGKKGDGGWRGGGGERGLLLSGPPPPPLSILSFSGGRAPSPPLFLILSGKQLLLERERENQGGGESGVFLGFPPEYLVRRQKVRTGGGRSTSFK